MYGLTTSLSTSSGDKDKDILCSTLEIPSSNLRGIVRLFLKFARSSRLSILCTALQLMAKILFKHRSAHADHFDDERIEQTQQEASHPSCWNEQRSFPLPRTSQPPASNNDYAHALHQVSRIQIGRVLYRLENSGLPLSAAPTSVIPGPHGLVFKSPA